MDGPTGFWNFICKLRYCILTLQNRPLQYIRVSVHQETPDENRIVVPQKPTIFKEAPKCSAKNCSTP